MQLVLKGKNFVISDRIRDYVQKKMGKLDRYLPAIDEARVEITQEKTKSIKDRNIVQVTLRTNGTILRAEDRSEAIYASIDAVVDKIHRQIARYKGKRIDRWQGNTRKQRQNEDTATSSATKLELAPNLTSDSSSSTRLAPLRRSVRISSPGKIFSPLEILRHGFCAPVEIQTDP